MAHERLPFADWLKACGLALIVWGHVAAATTPRWTPPVYPKQLGVAFFVFVTGFTLARETRPAWRVVYNRYFEVFVIGLLFALFMSAVGLVLWSDVNESNYLPLLGGTNIVLNDFPANPTTWYVGTYLHLLVIWALLLRRVRLGISILVIAGLAEVLVRAVLVAAAGPFPAYMAFSNWMTVFLLGMIVGQRHRNRLGNLPVVAGVLSCAAYTAMSNQLTWGRTFPLMSLAEPMPGVGLMTAFLVTCVYLGFTGAAYALLSRLPASKIASFLARNTVFVFVVHMPVYYLLEYALRPVVPGYGPRVLIEFVICLFVLAFVSEALHRRFHVARIRDDIWNWRPVLVRPAA